MADERPTPRDEDIPGGYPVTPSVNSIDQLTPMGNGADTADRLEAGYGFGAAGRETDTAAGYHTYDHVTADAGHGTSAVPAAIGAAAGGYLASQQPQATTPAQQSYNHNDNNTLHNSQNSTVPQYQHDTAPAAVPVAAPILGRNSSSSTVLPRETSTDTRNHALPTKEAHSPSDASPDEPIFAPIKSHTENTENPEKPPLEKRNSRRTEEDLFRVLSRRKTNASTPAEKDDENEDNEELDRLMSRIFGQKRQEQSEEEKTRHSGVIFRGLTVRGVGLGSSLQPTVGDFFMGLPRKLGKLFTQGPKAALAKPPVRDLISNFDGCVRPGELLLVLGRPGAGCSTFLKTFCNQRAGFESIEGDVTYGGTDAGTMAKDFRGEIIYNPEDDLHYATLSVKRTLTFALQTRTPGKESRLEGETRQDYVREFLRVVTKLFWIEHTLGTKVGNEFIRGVSGGERKRVSIAEAMITRASVQGWDNSSKGLDASTAVEYVKSIRAMTNMADTSTAVSLYQAGEQLYDLVDKVLLIDQGKCLYYGRAEDAKKYFLSLGFDCPERWTTADFLTSVTDEHERSIRDGWENRIPRTPEDFSDAYRRSEDYQKNLRDIDDFERELQTLAEERRQHESEKSKKKNYEISFFKQVMACTHRQFLVMFGDKASLFGKWGGLLFQGLIVGSLFFNLPDTAAGAFPRGGALFFLLLFNALLALAEQTAAFESKPILLKHKSFSFYRPSAFAIAQTVVDVPLVFIQVIIFNVLIYFMANLARTASQFFISNLILWLVTMVTYAFFRAISAWCGTLDVATRFTGVAIQILVVYTGYLIPPSSMHPWFGWLRWINWIQYGFECLMANEFAYLDLECEAPYLVPQGPNARPQNQGCALAGASPGSTTVSGAAYIEQSFTYTRSHLWRNFGFLWAFFLFFVFLTALGMELMKPNVGGGAITVFKRGQVPKKVEESIATGGRAKGDKHDEESGQGNPVAAGDAERTKSNEQVTQEVAKNETVFTFQNINYTIPFEKGERKLLQDVQGYVRPGKLTALMGASGKSPNCTSLPSSNIPRRRQNNTAQWSRPTSQIWHHHW
jgi:ABC-type multidrug transport system ATPase subunit/ABC-type multidrug transport system permease subunit